MNRRPADTEYPSFYAGYISHVPEEAVLPVLAGQVDLLRRVADSVTEDRETFRYEPGKWSVRELFGHLGDGERVFGFRAFCFSRGEAQPLPIFDQESYVAHADYDRRSLESLVGDWIEVRQVNLALLRRLDGEAWERVGTAAGAPVTVRALAYVMAGHVRHHLKILAERYGVGPGPRV